MSLTLALNNAMSGLGATARMAEVVSSNLSNALTEGYARRSVDLSPATLDGRGAGVRIDGVSRQQDRFLLADRRDAEATLERRESLLKGLGALEGAMGTAAEGTSLSARLAALEGSLVSASADPASDARLAQVLRDLGQLTDTLNDEAVAVQAGRQDAEDAIARQVDALNANLRSIEGLNHDIVAAQTMGRDATGFMDQRQLLIDEVARAVPVREMERPGGAVALITPQGAVLLDGRAAVVGFDAAHTITAGMTLADGPLEGLTLDGREMTPAGAGRLGGGAIEASFVLRDETLPAVGAELDAMAQDLIERFVSAENPPLSASTAGLLTDAGVPHDPSNNVGLAGRIAVNEDADPAEDGSLSLLRDGLGATTPRAAGDATQIDRWLDALDVPTTLVTGGQAGSAATLAAGVEAGVSAQRLAAEEEVSYASSRWTSLKESELAGGVDSDHEMQMLLAIEQAYAANARVIAAIEAMMQSIMEI